MRLLKLAIRNLFRNTRRTVLTVAAIGFGLSLMIYMVNFQKGSYGAMIEAGVASQAGHVVVQADGYQEEKEVTMLVDDASVVASQMQAEFPDGVVAPRIFMGGLLMSNRRPTTTGATEESFGCRSPSLVPTFSETFSLHH